MLLAASPRGLALCAFAARRSVRGLLAEVPARKWDAEAEGDPAARRHLDLAARELREYFRGTLKKFTVPLDLRGAEFEVRVWRALLQIPYGQTRSYGAIARSLGNPRAARAVGGANNRNWIAIAVPCHRVIGAAGQLTGYGGGLERKRFLLAHEGGFDFSGVKNLDAGA
jgi:O-6-methylguanine DNA methyltransferase